MSDIEAGWPCALLPTVAPSVADVLSNPTADQILPQLLQLTPRGAAWGTDEAGSGLGGQPFMLDVWRAVAGHAAQNYTIEFELATQCFPSAITFSLADWEAEYGLPDSCTSGASSTAQRIAAVRAKFGAIGGQSIAYFVCLAASVGYDITITEPSQFLCGESECTGDGITETWFECGDGACGDTPLEGFTLGVDQDPLNADNEVSAESQWKYWVVHVQSLGLTWFTTDESECGYDPISGFLTALDLECLLRRYCPPHTELVFDYSALTTVGTLNGSVIGNFGLYALLF